MKNNFTSHGCLLIVIIKSSCKLFFKTSDMILVQPFMPTDFDWKNEYLFIHDSVPIQAVPAAVVNLALESSRLIGDGLYGVDIKSINNQHYLIEVNDNPSINFGIEDEIPKNTLYEKIMDVILQRILQRDMLMEAKVFQKDTIC